MSEGKCRASCLWNGNSDAACVLPEQDEEYCSQDECPYLNVDIVEVKRLHRAALLKQPRKEVVE